MLRERSRLLQRLLFLVDLGLIAVAWVFAFWIRFHVLSGPLAPLGPIPPTSTYLAFLPAVLAIWGGALLVSGLYRAHRAERFSLIIWAVVRAAALSFVISIGATFFYRAFSFSRLHMLLFGVISGGLLIGLRLGVYVILRQAREKGHNVRKVLIVGAGKAGQRLARAFEHYPWMGFKVIGFLDDRSHVPVEPSDALYPKQHIDPTILGQVTDIDRVFDQNEIDFVYVALPLSATQKIETVARECATHTASLFLVPDLFQMDLLLNSRISDVDGLPVIHLMDEAPFDFRQVVKRGIDITFSISILLLLSPLLLAIALAVKLSSRGPVFYKQVRMGLNGQTFAMIKFRSMPVDTESQSGAVWAEKNENRATRVGSFLRKTSLDELPQFFNVLRGDMSVVGPRPERPVFIERFRHEIPGYMLRHKTKAGITGWAQIHGWRGNTSLKKRIEYDLYYIQNWSLTLDLKIMALTVTRGLVSENAY